MCLNSPSPPAGVLQSGDSIQTGGAARRSDQEEHLSAPGCLQGIPVKTGLQEEEGKAAASELKPLSWNIFAIFTAL